MFGDLCRLQLLSGSHDRECKQRLCKSLYEKAKSSSVMRVKTTTSVPLALICIYFPCPSACAVCCWKAPGRQCLAQGRALPDTGMLWQEGYRGCRNAGASGKSHPSSFLGGSGWNLILRAEGAQDCSWGEKGHEVCGASPSIVPWH